MSCQPIAGLSLIVPCASRPPLRLLQRELLQRDRFGRAVEIQRDVREFAGRTDRERALRRGISRRCRSVELAMRRKQLTREIGGQFDAFPLVRTSRKPVSRRVALRRSRSAAGGFGRFQRQRLDLQQVAGQRIAERFELTR